MSRNKYRSAQLLAEVRHAFIAQGIKAKDALLYEVVATLVRLAPHYSGEDAQRWCESSSESGQ